jgi:hypothetical protein
VIAFVPDGGHVRTVVARTLDDMKLLVVGCSLLGYQVILNAGWTAQLGVVGRLGDTGDARGWQTPIGDPTRGR